MTRWEDHQRFATVESLSPEAREMYEAFTSGKPQSPLTKHWLRYGYYVMDDDMNAVEAPFIEWAAQYGGDRHHERQIRIDKIGDWMISTVFLGMDHGFQRDDDPDYKPVLWETMIFWQGEEGKCPHPELDNDCDRYTSTKAAIRGHELMVDRVRIAVANGL